MKEQTDAALAVLLVAKRQLQTLYLTFKSSLKRRQEPSPSPGYGNYNPEIKFKYLNPDLIFLVQFLALSFVFKVATMPIDWKNVARWTLFLTYIFSFIALGLAISFDLIQSTFMISDSGFLENNLTISNLHGRQGPGITKIVVSFAALALTTNVSCSRI